MNHYATGYSSLVGNESPFSRTHTPDDEVYTGPLEKCIWCRDQFRPDELTNEGLCWKCMNVIQGLGER